MKSVAKRALVPTLRFPEFRDAREWEDPELHEIAVPVVERVGDRRLTPISISAGIGFVPQAEKFGRDISGNQYRLYTLVRDGDFVYNKGNSLKFPQGCIYDLQGWGAVAAPNVFICFRLKHGYVNGFFSYSFEKNVHGLQLRKHITSGARSNGLLNINKDDFFAVKVPTPKREEQQKIADCLSSIDELVTLEAQKLDTFKAHKKGLMQQLFPAEGETLPTFRFPEFRDAREWEKKILGQVFNRITTKNAENNQNVLTISSQAGLVSQLDYFNKSIAAKDVTGYYLLRRGDFGYNKSSSQGYPMGAIKRLKNYEKGVVSTLYICLRVNNGYSESFFEQYFDAGALNSEIAGIAKEGARNHGLLNMGVNEFFNDVQVTCPRIEEQQKIADCLSSIDELIVAQTQKLATLKAHKKGLMQQLFPALDGVQG